MTRKVPDVPELAPDEDGNHSMEKDFATILLYAYKLRLLLKVAYITIDEYETADKNRMIRLENQLETMLIPSEHDMLPK